MQRPHPDPLVPTRESLLSRLKNWGDQEGWQEFFTIYRPLIYGTAVKAGLSQEEAEDIVQETFLSVAKTIKGFRYDPQRCRFKSWLGHLTRKRIADRFRRRSREHAVPSDLAGEHFADPDSLNLDAIWDEQWRQTILDTALAQTKAQVNPEQYQMFDLYVLRNMPARKVAASLGTNVAQVYLAKHRISKLVKSEIKSFEGADGLNVGCRLPLMKQNAPTDLDCDVIRCIGQGSYGQVWLVRDKTGQYRACKIIYRAHFDSDRPYEREYAGIRQFEPVSRRSDSQIKILETGRRDPAGYFYYLMELADDASGRPEINPSVYLPKTLRGERLRRGKLPVKECIEIGLSLGAALENLHQNGLVHRDIKPANIIFVRGVPKLADIGLVTAMGLGMSCVGTEGFMPPEGPGSPKADIYSLGKVLYEIATGRDRLDFPELPTAIGELADGEKFLEFNSIIVKACQPNPRKRYQSARQLSLELALLQRGKSIRRKRQRVVLAGRIGFSLAALGCTAALILAIPKRPSPATSGTPLTVLTLKVAPPLQGLVAEKEKQVRQVFNAQLAKDGATEKVRIAKELLNRSAHIDEPVLQLATLRCATDLAAEAADVSLVRRACNAIGDRFLLNPSQLKLEALEKTALHAKTPESLASLAEGCLASGFEAIAVDDYAIANHLRELAGNVTLTSTNLHLIEETQFLSNEVDRCAAEYAAARKFIQIRRQNTNDPESNLEVGKFLCFIKGDWDDGLPLLARGSSDGMKSAALEEIARPLATSDQDIRMGDRWWNLAGAAPEADWRALRRRARYWYLKAIANSKDGEKASVREQLANRIRSVPVTAAELHICSHVAASEYIEIYNNEIRWSSTGRSTRNKINHVRVADHQSGTVTIIKNYGATRLLPDAVDFTTATLTIDAKPRVRGKVSLDIIAEDHVRLNLSDTRPSPAELDVTVTFGESHAQANAAP